MASYTAVVVVLLAMSSCASAHFYNKTHDTLLTYYGEQTPPGRGHCSLHINDLTELPWASKVQMWLGMETQLYGNSKPCGMCVMYRATDGPRDLGYDRPPTEWQYGMIADETEPWRLDLQKTGGGHYEAQWRAVQCPVDDSKFVFSFSTSNHWFQKISVGNARVPTAKFELINDDGSLTPLERVRDNFFQQQGPWTSLPLRVRLTSTLGDQVDDVIQSDSHDLNDADQTFAVPGSAQYPLRKDLIY